MSRVVDQPATVLEPFDQRHVAAAAELVAGRVRGDLAATTIVPARQAEPGVHAAVLEQLAARGSGVAAMRDGRHFSPVTLSLLRRVR